MRQRTITEDYCYEFIKNQEGGKDAVDKFVPALRKVEISHDMNGLDWTVASSWLCGVERNQTETASFVLSEKVH